MNSKIVKLIVLIGFISIGSCGPKSSITPTNTSSPLGTFSGQFSYYHLNSKTGKKDSLKASILLNLNQTTGFTVTGDTATVHAGSHGGFVINNTYTNILFIDETYPKTGTPTKTHLNGVYNYTYDGTNLQMAAYGALDTLSLVYILKRTAN